MIFVVVVVTVVVGIVSAAVGMYNLPSVSKSNSGTFILLCLSSSTLVFLFLCCFFMVEGRGTVAFQQY